MPFLQDTERISSLAVELLARSIVLPGTVSRVPGTDYRGTGGTITLRVPQRRTALEQANPGDAITIGAIDETPVTFDLSHWYDAVRVSDEDLTLSIEDFGRQVLQPMIAAIAEAGEDRLAAAMNAASASATIEFGLSPDPSADENVILAMREELTANDVPAGGRFLAVAPDIASRLLKIEKFSRVDASGAPTALREATLGRLYGLTVVESNALDAGSALAYHRSGFAFATLAPALPQGAASASASIAQGIALRVVYDYSVSILSDAVAVSTFGAGSLVDADRVVRVETGS
jgi:hypothetical protein